MENKLIESFELTGNARNNDLQKDTDVQKAIQQQNNLLKKNNII